MADPQWQAIVIKLLDQEKLDVQEQDYLQKNIDRLIEHFSRFDEDKEFADYLKSLKK
jgi:hypothetical protein